MDGAVVTSQQVARNQMAVCPSDAPHVTQLAPDGRFACCKLPQHHTKRVRIRLLSAARAHHHFWRGLHTHTKGSRRPAA